MEKYDPTHPDTDDSSSSSAYEDTAFLNSHYVKEDKKRRQMMLLTFFNLFLFVISGMSLTCAVITQRSPSSHSAAKLMDQFGIFCE